MDKASPISMGISNGITGPKFSFIARVCGIMGHGRRRKTTMIMGIVTSLHYFVKES